MSVRKQCELLNVHRSCVYYHSKPAQNVNHERHKALILSINGKLPSYGYRKITLELHSRNNALSEKQVRRLMPSMHLKALHAKRMTSVKHPENPIYPYLLNNIVVRFSSRNLKRAFLAPDNNAVENAIRPFVLGRKNWLFSNTQAGAYTSVGLYSLI